MLNNLKSEYTRKGIEPYKGIMNVLDCSEKNSKEKVKRTERDNSFRSFDYHTNRF